jgi:cytochrome c biogenesis protein CcmG, thiol:disulfide interchange protein DsbE
MTEVARPHQREPAQSPRRSVMAVGTVLIGSLLFGLLVLPRLEPREGRSGALAPEFSLPIVAGGDASSRISLFAQRGKVVVLDFWATWCGPCAEQTKILERYAMVARPDVLVLGVNEGEPMTLLRPYFERRTPGYPVVADADESVGQGLFVRGLPTLVIIDRNGRISSETTGVTPYARLERLVADASAGR